MIKLIITIIALTLSQLSIASTSSIFTINYGYNENVVNNSFADEDINSCFIYLSQLNEVAKSNFPYLSYGKGTVKQLNIGKDKSEKSLKGITICKVDVYIDKTDFENCYYDFRNDLSFVNSIVPSPKGLKVSKPEIYQSICGDESLNIQSVVVAGEILKYLKTLGFTGNLNSDVSDVAYFHQNSMELTKKQVDKINKIIYKNKKSFDMYYE